MERAARILGTHWFHRRFALTPEGRYVTVTELAEWARGPYDQLRKNLLLRSRTTESAPRVVLLAPARHGEGATTTAVLLAASLATTHRCLLMELNFRRPGIALALGLDETPGLSALLKNAVGHIGGGEIERAIQRTGVANLFALPNSIDGTQRALPEIEAVETIVGHVRQSFDYVVIDAAPVLGYPDTALFAPLADAVVLIVAADSTPVETGVEARREIERARAHIVGAVLTRQRRFVPEVLARRVGSTNQ